MVAIQTGTFLEPEQEGGSGLWDWSFDEASKDIRGEGMEVRVNKNLASLSQGQGLIELS